MNRHEIFYIDKPFLFIFSLLFIPPIYLAYYSFSSKSKVSFDSIINQTFGYYSDTTKIIIQPFSSNHASNINKSQDDLLPDPINNKKSSKKLSTSSEKYTENFRRIIENLYTKSFSSPLYKNDFPHISADREKQDAIKEAFSFAWHSYADYCWGHDELLPLSLNCKDWLNSGLTIIDSMDTLILMGMEEEYEMSREFVLNNFSMNGQWSLFELLIRFVGGFVSLYDMTQDELYLSRVVTITDAILELFDEDGYYIAPILIDSTNDKIKVSQLKGTYLLSEVGSYQLEFIGLSRITDNPLYLTLCLKAFKKIWKIFPNEPIIPGFHADHKVNNRYYIGPMTDSYYEYIIKTYVETAGCSPTLLDHHTAIMKELKEKFLIRTPLDNLTVIGEIEGRRVKGKQEHLATFLAGAIAVGTVKNNNQMNEDLQLARELVDQYAYLYRNHRQKVMSEIVNFNLNPKMDKVFFVEDNKYMLRPETVESIYVLWKFTGDQIYRDYAWEIFLALNTTCRMQNGFSSIEGTNSEKKRFLNDMPSFFLAETLKYLYLTFCDSALLSPTQWVFNTEAHPIKIFSDKDVKKWEKTINKILRPQLH